MGFHLLVVEDSSADCRLIRLGVAQCPGCRMSVAENGEVALALLRREECERPDLILLDLNLPRMSGHEFLRALMHDERLRGIPVVVFSGSPSPHDRHAARAGGARDYVVKPSSLEPFLAAVEGTVRTWLDRAEGGRGC